VSVFRLLATYRGLILRHGTTPLTRWQESSI
jgi:hypothetical protein